MRHTMTSLRPRILGQRKDGRPIYSIAGASPDDPSNPPSDPPSDPPADPPSDLKPDDGDKTFTQADVDRIIQGRLSKYADYDEVKAELDKVRQANQTEAEKAVEAAKVEARAEAIREAAPRLVAAEFRAALAGRRTADEVAELIEDLDLSKYLTEAGEVDAERVTKKADLLAPPGEERKTPPSFGGGPRKADDKAEVAPGRPRLLHAYANPKK